MPILCSWPSHVVDESTVDDPHQITAACGSMPSSAVAPVQSVAIECFTGRLGRFLSGPASTLFVDGKALRRLDRDDVYLQGNGWQEEVALPPSLGASSLGARILGSVRPSGGAC